MRHTKFPVAIMALTGLATACLPAYGAAAALTPHTHSRLMSTPHTVGQVAAPIQVQHGSSPIVVGTHGSSRSRRAVAPLQLTWGTNVLRGTMRSDSVVRMTAAFSVGQAASLNWNLPRPTSLHLNGWSERVRSIRYTFTVQPQSWTDMQLNGHAVRQFHWISPPAHTVISVVEQLHIITRTTLSPLQTHAAFPLRRISPAAQPYLKLTPLVRLPRWGKRFVRSLAHGQTREKRVVNTIVNWVASHVHYAYGGTIPAVDARGVLRSRAAICGGYADLVAGMLRTLHIPTQVVFGLVAGKPVQLGNGRSFGSIGWGTGANTGEMHAWLNVYFPDAGWVPLDPQLEKFFIDTRHLAFETNIDAGPTGMGTWTVKAIGHAQPTGRTLSNGSVAVAPADGISSTVGIHIRDSFHVQFRTSRADVRHILLLSR